MSKVSLLASLYKLAKENKIHELLTRNFSEDRWKTAALKNAHVLKSKQRFELSAAFFILGHIRNLLYYFIYLHCNILIFLS